MDSSTIVQEVVWLWKLPTRLFGKILGPSMIQCDNQSYVQMSVNLVFHDKSKHIEIQYHFIRDMV